MVHHVLDGGRLCKHPWPLWCRCPRLVMRLMSMAWLGGFMGSFVHPVGKVESCGVGDGVGMVPR